MDFSRNGSSEPDDPLTMRIQHFKVQEAWKRVNYWFTSHNGPSDVCWSIATHLSCACFTQYAQQTHPSAVKSLNLNTSVTAMEKIVAHHNPLSFTNTYVSKTKLTWFLWIFWPQFPYTFTVSIGTQATIISIITHILNPLSFFNNLEIDKTSSMNLVHTLLETKLYNKPLSVLIYHTHEENPKSLKKDSHYCCLFTISKQFCSFDQQLSCHHCHPYPQSTIFLQ